MPKIVNLTIPYKNYKLKGKYYIGKNQKTKSLKIFLILHWMDSRGSNGNDIYIELAEYFSSKGIIVFIYEQLGSKESPGLYEYPRFQYQQTLTVYEFIKETLLKDHNIIDFEIIPIVHSIAAITIMKAYESGLPFKKLIWLGGPASHGLSIRRMIKERGTFTWYKFLIFSFLDRFTGVFGLPFYHKMFGFKLRLKDVKREFFSYHGARMMIKHPELTILGLFGNEDEFNTMEELESELPQQKYGHFKRLIIDGASHSFEGHFSRVINEIEQFTNKNKHDSS